MIKGKSFNEFKFEPTHNELENIYASFEKSESILSKDRNCYIFVYGKQPKSRIRAIETIEGAEVISIDFYGPRVLKFLDFLISGFSTLIKITNPKIIGEVMTSMTHLSMAAIFSFNSDFENDFIDYHSKNNFKSYYPEDFIKKANEYFCFLIDGDNVETESGYFAKVNFAEDCPKDLRKIFLNFGEYGYVGEKQL